MHWEISQLDSSRRERLAAISASQGAAAPDAYFASRHRPRLALVVGIACLLLGLVAAAMAAVNVVAVAPAVLLLGYGVLCLLALRADPWNIRPFVMVTPSAVIKVGMPRGCVEGYQLRDATEFKKTTVYTSRQVYNGLVYLFVFPDGKVSFREKDSRQLEKLDAVLARARAGEARAGEMLLAEGGRPGAPALANILDPFSNFWVQFWVVIGLIVIIAVIILINR